MDTIKSNGWSKYEELVIYRLNATDVKLDKLDRDVHEIRELITALRITAGVIGGLAGAGVALLAALVGG